VKLSDLLAPCVLLVEDEAIILEVLEQELREAGFEVVGVSSGSHAIAALDQDSSRFACIVTDIDLGKGPNGWQIAHRARELNHSFPIIYMSGRRAIDWPVDGVPESVMLQKPFAAAQLITAISTKLLDSQRIIQQAPPTSSTE
jgi:DNA-binding NtrC family response regulator